MAQARHRTNASAFCVESIASRRQAEGDRELSARDGVLSLGHGEEGGKQQIVRSLLFEEVLFPTGGSCFLDGSSCARDMRGCL